MNIPGLTKLSETEPGAAGYISSLAPTANGNFMAAGSSNMTLSGGGKTQVHKGATQRMGIKGGFIAQPVAETWATLGQTSDGSAYGSIVNVFAALFYIGKGLLRLAGTSLLVNASATLSILIKHSGSFFDTLSGPFQAGLAAPSAPIIRAIDPPSGFTGKLNGTQSTVIWRIRTTTGGQSNKSPVSNVITTVNQSEAITFPLVDANGQDAWGIGVTKQIEGRTGAHFQYKQITEAELTQALARTDVVTSNASLDITSATAGFTSQHIGWLAVLSGGTPATTFTGYVVAVPAANKLTLDHMPTTNSTGVHLALTHGVEGTARTYVIEYEDGDLVGRPYAPDRNYPPPSGLLAGSLEDVAFVDGCYPDAGVSISGTNRGTAIAPSEKGQPEAYSPDTVIFTNDAPIALLRGDGLYMRVCKNSTYAISYLGGAQPLAVEPVWENIGIDHQGQACMGEGSRLYLWPTLQGLIRMGGDGKPENTFAVPIRDDLIACTDSSKRILGWDGLGHALVVCYAKQVWAMFPALNDAWAAPITLSMLTGGVRSAVAENGNQLLLVDENDDVWAYGVGNGLTAHVRTPWIRSSGVLDTIAALVARVRADNNSQAITFKLYADGDGSTAVSTLSITPTRTGIQELPPVWPNAIDCDSHQVEIVITSATSQGDCGVDHIESFGPSQFTTR